jgi:hypothetical protein
MEKPQLWFILGVSLIFTSIVVQWSFRLGRLSMDPVYDDVVYLLDARDRLKDFDRNGIATLAQSLWSNPPHSPWSTAAALGGFLIFGINAWAPYAINGLLVIGMLLAADHFFGVKAFWLRALMSLSILGLPMMVRAVHDFRPDFAVALATAVACMMTIERGVIDTDWKGCTWRPFLDGGLFGLAYLAKPSFVYHTTALLLLTISISEAAVWLGRLRSPAPKSHGVIDCLGRIGVFSAGCVTVAGLYYLKNWKAVIEYVSTNTGSGKDASIWMIPGGMWVTLKAYVISGYMAEMLGPFFWLLLGAILIGLVFNTMQGNWRRAAFIGAGLVCATVSLGIMCVAQINNPFFGLTWQILIAFTGVFSVGTLSQKNSLASPAIVFALAIGLTKIFQPPFQDVWQMYPDGLVNQSLNKALVKRFEQLSPVNPNDRQKKFPFIYVTFAGPVVDEYSQRWVAEDERYPAQFADLARSGDLKEHRLMIARADVVEVASEDAYWVAPVLPSAHLRRDLLAMMRSDPAFCEVAPVCGQGGEVFVFVRKATFHCEPDFS